MQTKPRFFSFLLALTLLTACQAPVAMPPTSTATASPPTASQTASPTLPPPTATPDSGIITAANLSKLKKVRTMGLGGLFTVDNQKLQPDLGVAPIFLKDQPQLLIATSSGIYGYNTDNYQASPQQLFDRGKSMIASNDGQWLLIDHQLVALNSEKKAPKLLYGDLPEYAFMRNAAFSPDSQLVAISIEAGQNDDQIHLFRVSDGKKIYTLPGQTIRFSKDGQYLLSSLYNRKNYDEIHTYIYDLQSGEQLQAWEGDHGELFPNGMALVQKNKQVTIYDMQSGRRLRVLDGEFQALSEDGTSLLLFRQGVFRQYQVGTWKSINILAGEFQYANLRYARFSPDGKYIAAIAAIHPSDYQILLWRAEDGKLIKKMVGSFYQTIGVFNFSPDGKTLAFGYDNPNSLEIWQTADGATLARLSEFTGTVHKIIFTPDGKQIISLAAANMDGSINFYEAATGQRLQSWITTIGYSEDQELAIDPYGETLTVNLNFWSMETGKESPNSPLDKLYDGVGGSFGADFSPDGRLFASGAMNGRFMVWDFEKQSIAFDGTICDESANVGCLNFSPDGQQLALGCTYMGGEPIDTPALWVYNLSGDHPSLQKVEAPPPYNAPGVPGFNLTGWTPDGRFLIGVGQYLQIWDAVSKKPIITTDNVSGVGMAISPDSTILAIAGGMETTVQLYSLPDGKLLGTLGNMYANDVDFSPDGKFLVTGGASGVTTLWAILP